MIYQTTHNTSVEQFLGGNVLYYTFMIYIYTSKSMLAEVSRSGFEGLVYGFSSPVDRARVCFVYKVYKFPHAWVYPIISWQQFSTVGIIQWTDRHEMKLVFNFYIANMTFALCIRHRWFICLSHRPVSSLRRRLLDCLLNRLFRHKSKKAPKPRVTGLCVGNSPVILKFRWFFPCIQLTISQYWFRS